MQGFDAFVTFVARETATDTADGQPRDALLAVLVDSHREIVRVLAQNAPGADPARRPDSSTAHRSGSEEGRRTSAYVLSPAGRVAQPQPRCGVASAPVIRPLSRCSPHVGAPPARRRNCRNSRRVRGP